MRPFPLAFSPSNMPFFWRRCRCITPHMTNPAQTSFFCIYSCQLVLSALFGPLSARLILAVRSFFALEFLPSATPACFWFVQLRALLPSLRFAQPSRPFRSIFLFFTPYPFVRTRQPFRETLFFPTLTLFFLWWCPPHRAPMASSRHRTQPPPLAPFKFPCPAVQSPPISHPSRWTLRRTLFADWENAS